MHVDFGLVYDGSLECQRTSSLYTSGRFMSVSITLRMALMHFLKFEV